MIVELNEKEIEVLKDVLSEATTVPEFVEGDLILFRNYRSYSAMVGKVTRVGTRKNSIVPEYDVDILETETEDVYEPSTGIQYAFGSGFSYPTVYVKKVLKGVTEKVRSKMTISKPVGSSAHTYKLNPSTGRYGELKDYRVRKLQDNETIVLGEYEIDDQERVKEIFAKHPDWEKEEPKVYDMSKK